MWNLPHWTSWKWGFPTKDIDDFVKRRLYKSESEPKSNPFHFDKDHLNSTEVQ